MEDYLIGIAVSVILNAVKNPAKKTDIRNIALKVYRSIKAAFAGDPDFV